MPPPKKEEGHKLFIGLILAILFFWFVVIFVNTRGVILAPIGDFQRDTAITYNILAGNFLGDAAYLGEHAWYPFLSQIIYAVAHLLTGIPVQTLYAGYPFLLSLPAILIFVFSAHKLYQSFAYSALALFSLVFVIPWTNHQLQLNTHPVALALGTLTLGIYLFWRAVTKKGWQDWVLAGVGIALVIYSQTIAAITLCGGILLYQLSSRKDWPKFFLMILTAFVIVSPYFIPLVRGYHLTPRNHFGTFFFQYFKPPEDAYFYGFGPTRWLNSLFIATGIWLFLRRRRLADKIILSVFFFGLFVEYAGIARHEGLLPSFLPVFVPQDFQLFNHLVAIFPLVGGILFWLEKLHLKRPAFLLGVIGFYAIFTIPPFFDRLVERRTYLLSGWNQVPDWYAATRWIWDNTNISDVFLASQDMSFIYISGMTGRKVVATENAHANTFVDQSQRVNDLKTLFQTTDMGAFKNLAQRYHVSYIAISPFEAEIAGEGLTKFLSDPLFVPTFSSGSLRIFRLSW